MSVHVTSLVWKVDLGSIARKAVMLILADKADDFGGGIWASKQTMADELCCSIQHVRNIISAFVDEGLLREVGQRHIANGFVVEYAIVMPALRGLQLVNCHAQKEGLFEPQLPLRGGAQKEATPQRGGGVRARARGREPLNGVDPSTQLTPQPHGGDTPTQLPQTTPEPEEPSDANASSGKRAKRATQFNPFWEPELTPRFQRIVDAWPDGMFDREVQQFIDHHKAKASKFVDWQAAFRTWISNADKWKDQHNGTANRNRSDDRRAQRDPLSVAYYNTLAEAAREDQGDHP